MTTQLGKKDSRPQSSCSGGKIPISTASARYTRFFLFFFFVLDGCEKKERKKERDEKEAWEFVEEKSFLLLFLDRLSISGRPKKENWSHSPLIRRLVPANGKYG